MRIRSIFVAYPYTLGMAYRSALENRFAGSGIEFRYADDELANTHVMAKIARMMNEADVCFFDVSGGNPNVLFELGYALGAQEPGFVVVSTEAIPSLNADIVGWDSLRYMGFDDLAEQVFERVTKGRVPTRHRDTGTVQPIGRGPQDILRELRFGVPPSDRARLVIYAVPTLYERHYHSRALFGTPPFRAKDLGESIDRAINVTRYDTHFWPRGYDYDYRPGPDFLEVYLGVEGGTSGDRSTNFRIYLSGVVTYMQRLRRRDPNDSPFLYLYMYEEIVEMALIAISDIRSRWGFGEQRNISVGSLFLNAPDLRVSEATRDFYPMGDVGRPLAEPEDVVWIPREPSPAPTKDFNPKAISEEFAADLRVQLL